VTLITPKKHGIYFVFYLMFLLCSGCASTTSGEQDIGDAKDPFESINRPIWTFTQDYADHYLLKPASQAYTEYTPKPLRTGLYNMALNINEPASMINALLQLKFNDAAQNAGRFLLNSTIGLFGFFDPADDFGWTRKEEEFGEVLGHYNVGDGPYLMVMGPSSVREEVGDYVDGAYWPLAVIDFWPNLLRLSVLALEGRASLADQEQLLNESLDSYEFVKNAYFQNMQYKVHDGNPPIEVNEDEEAELDAFMDEFEDDLE
jgi:phospholipid-binding lipoprotein MlaA